MQFQVGMHFCGGELKSTALFSKAKPCAHATNGKEEVPSCHSSKSENDDSEGCCDDCEFSMEALDITTTVDQYWSGFTSVFQRAIPSVVDMGAWRERGPADDLAYLHYKPPLLKLDIPVLIQSFLI